MPTVANGNRTAKEVIPANAGEQEEIEVKPKRGGGNPFLMRIVNAEMLSNPYPIDSLDDMMSNEFCYEKASKTLLQPLTFKSEKDWLTFCKQVWSWYESAETRESEAIANQFLSQYQDNPKIIEVLKQKLSE